MDFPYQVKEIAQGIYLVDEKFSTMFVITGATRALVVDCGLGAGDFRALVESLTPLPYDVVATHGHVDHVGGRGQFDKIYITETDAKIVKEANMFQRRGYAAIYRMAGVKLPRGAVRLEKVKKEPQFSFIREGDVFDLGGRVLKVIETPGHTHGSISLLLLGEGILFSGDAINPQLFLWLNHATTVESSVKTFDKIIALQDYSVVWQSHATSPAGREAAEINKKIAQSILTHKGNSFLPIIKSEKDADSGYMIIYRTSNVFDKHVK